MRFAPQTTLPAAPAGFPQRCRVGTAHQKGVSFRPAGVAHHAGYGLPVSAGPSSRTNSPNLSTCFT